MALKSLAVTGTRNRPSRKRKNRKQRKSASHPESSSYYNTLEVGDDIKNVEQKVIIEDTDSDQIERKRQWQEE